MRDNNPQERYSYEAWSNSQLSIVRHYGAISVNGHTYVLDYENCPNKIIEGEIKYFPDLVLMSSLKKNKKKESNKPINQLTITE